MDLTLNHGLDNPGSEDTHEDKHARVCALSLRLKETVGPSKDKKKKQPLTWRKTMVHAVLEAERGKLALHKGGEWASPNQLKALREKTDVPRGRSNSASRWPLDSSCNITSSLGF